MGKNIEKSNKKSVFKLRQIRYALVTSVVLLTILGLSAAFLFRIFLMTEKSCYDDLAVETEDAITDLESNLRSDRTMLRVIAGLIGNAEDMDSIEVSGYLANYDINSLITQIGILLPDNEYILAKGHRNSSDLMIDFKEESVLGEHISGVQTSETKSSTVVVRNYVPIRKDGICIGLLLSAASSSSIAKAWLPSVYDKKGYCYVVNQKTGEVIINTSSDQIKNISDISFTKTDSAYTKDGTVSNILNGKKGYSVFKSGSDNEKLYMCYMPFSIEDWEMVIFVPESAVFSEVSPIRKGMYMLGAIVAVILIIYAIWLIREIRDSISDAEEKANTDVLTGLQNRNRYETYLKKLGDFRDGLICIFIDANGLHDLNNAKGHFAGDQMLRFIADSLKVQFGGDNIYRIGGDEFIVFQYEKTEAEVNECLADFNDALKRNDYHAAVGICVAEQGMTADQIIETAEKSMYESKQKYYETIGKKMRV